MPDTPLPTLKTKDFATDQDVRWCPGCGDYSILIAVQRVCAKIGATREDTVFVSGIGCSSRFPYYMDTYGFHTIHGRAPGFVTGIKIANPDLNVWMVTGDGDGLSIGGNHLMHLLRRNVNVKIMLFNNQIYGLTKGQYSPTSPKGTVTKSTPMGSIDHPCNPLGLAFGADATFVARSMDRDPKHLRKVLNSAHAHKGASLVEIYQNCNVFNDGAFFNFTEKATKADQSLFVEQGQPLVFGAELNKGIRLDGFKPVVVSLDDYSADDLWIHDESDRVKAGIMASFGDPRMGEDLPRAFGVFFTEDRYTYEEAMIQQVADAVAKKGPGDLDALISGSHTWVVE